MEGFVKLLSLLNTLIGTVGPKAASIGILLVMAGQALQGHWNQIDGNTAIEALIALGLWGTRANKVSSERAGAK